MAQARGSDGHEWAGVHHGESLPTVPHYDVATSECTVKEGFQAVHISDSSSYLPDHVRLWTHAPAATARNMSSEAGAAVVAERNMTFFGGCRDYPKAIAWSLLLSFAIVMEAYDKSLISSFYAFPAFQRAYGTSTTPKKLSKTTQYQISPAWQAGLTNGAVCSEIFGLLLNGYLTDRFGYRKTMTLTLLWMCLGVCLSFFAVNITMLLAAQIVCGLPWGIIQVLAATYAADVMPVALRAHLLANVNMFWLVGQLIAASVLRGMVSSTSEWSYRIPFALQWAWAVPLLVGVAFAPESPWWLVRHDRAHEARQSLGRLTTRGFLDLEQTIALMIYTNKTEQRLSSRKMSYADCFRGSNLRRTEIACLVWLTQVFCGSTLTQYAAYFYEQAGFDPSQSFSLSTEMYGVGIFGGIISWFLLRFVGRRRLYLAGLLISIVILVAGGIFAFTPEVSVVSPWTMGSLLILLTFVYDMTIGPVCYVLVAEMPSTRLRVKTVVLARVSYNIAMVINNLLASRMLNPTAWGWNGKAELLFAGTAILCFIWCYFRLPESKGLAYVELDILFEKKAPTRKFGQFQRRLANRGYMSMLQIERSNLIWHGSQGYS